MKIGVLMYKKLLILSFLLFFTFSLTAQNSEEEVTNFFNEYWGLMQKGDIAQSIDYVYPKLFDFVPREVFENLTETSIAGISFRDVKINKLSKTITEGNEAFTLIDYSYSMNVLVKDLISPEDSINTDQDLIEYIDIMDSLYKITYGKKNVVLNKEKAEFSIFLKRQLIVVNDLTKSSSAFSLLEIKEESMGFYEKLFPSIVMKKLIK